MPVSPITQQDQPTLIQEFDLNVTKTLVGNQLLRVSPEWFSNGVWAMRRTRVKNQTLFTCGCCLERFTGQHTLQPFDDYSVEALYPSTAVMERWARTEHVIDQHGTDFVRYVSDTGQVMYMHRAFSEALNLQYVYGDDPERGLWNDAELSDATVVMPGHREPQFIRLRFADLLAASDDSEESDDPLDLSGLLDSPVPTITEPQLDTLTLLIRQADLLRDQDGREHTMFLFTDGTWLDSDGHHQYRRGDDLTFSFNEDGVGRSHPGGNGSRFVYHNDAEADPWPRPYRNPLSHLSYAVQSGDLRLEVTPRGEINGPCQMTAELYRLAYDVANLGPALDDLRREVNPVSDEARNGLVQRIGTTLQNLLQPESFRTLLRTQEGQADSERARVWQLMANLINVGQVLPGNSEQGNTQDAGASPSQPAPSSRRRRNTTQDPAIMVGPLNPNAMRNWAPNVIRYRPGWFPIPPDHVLQAEVSPVTAGMSVVNLCSSDIRPDEHQSVEVFVGQEGTITTVRVRTRAGDTLEFVPERAELHPYAVPVQVEEPNEDAVDATASPENDLPFERPSIPEEGQPRELSATLFETLRTSALAANMSDPDTWRVHRVANQRIVPIAMNDDDGILLALRATTMNAVRALGGAIRRVRSGNSCLWVSENAEAFLYAADSESASTRDWSFDINGTQCRATFIPNWNDNPPTHYVTVFVGQQAHARHVPVDRLRGTSLDHVEAFLREIAAEVIAEL